ncbi:unnamed protein product [Eruca vesicaria subsp. sativa]|uniref:Uncharacterized protein n=1 Tax=Eruca vesicaria subsp. sativa TaxID=29727 RepID=A0ABC8IYK6_ERUVS|nr:unnamed protein product [Eruca vesicaria subsp. sativa]
MRLSAPKGDDEEKDESLENKEVIEKTLTLVGVLRLDVGFVVTVAYALFYICLDKKSGFLAALMCFACWVGSSVLADRLGPSLSVKEIVVLCMARVTRINSEKGWSDPTLLAVNVAVNSGALIVVLRVYRVELSIADNTAEGVFMCFDGVMTKLHRIEAHEAGQVLGNNGVNADYSPVPLFISEMKGKIYAFHVRLPADRALSLLSAINFQLYQGKGTSSATSMPAFHSLIQQPGLGASGVDRGFISGPALIGDVLINFADPDADIGKDKRMSLD